MTSKPPDFKPLRVSYVGAEPMTPELQAWLTAFEESLNAEARRRGFNLMAYGTTHPEAAGERDA